MNDRDWICLECHTRHTREDAAAGSGLCWRCKAILYEEGSTVVAWRRVGNAFDALVDAVRRDKYMWRNVYFWAVIFTIGYAAGKLT